MILYLHGFRSSPHSTKARLMAETMAALGLQDQYLCPQLAVAPSDAARQIEDLIAPFEADAVTVIGSSLGGFYATWLAERKGCKAVLLNPAIRPDRDLRGHLGVQTVYHSDATIEILPTHIDQLASLRVVNITRPERYFLVAAKGDEVLDWREMVAHYPGAHRLLIEGSDHGLSDFPVCIDRVLAFAGLTTLTDPQD